MRALTVCMAGCGAPEGFHRAVSACQVMKPQHTPRYNGAGRIPAVCALQHNQCVHSADVGDACGSGLRMCVPAAIGQGGAAA